MTATIFKPSIKSKARSGHKRHAKKFKALHKLSRAELLDCLRLESRQRAGTAYSFEENTPLVELAYFAFCARKRSVSWRGIRFPLRHSLWIVVLDPESFEPLISAPGGIL